MSAKKPSVLVEAEEIINGQRQADYGSPLESFDRIAQLWSAVLVALGGKPISAETVCLLLALLKVSRAIQGLKMGSFHRDSYVDLAGYAGCAEKIADERSKT